MNVKEALKIKADPFHCWDEGCCSVCDMAKGYLEAIEQTKPLVEFVEDLANPDGSFGIEKEAYRLMQDYKKTMGEG